MGKSHPKTNTQETRKLEIDNNSIKSKILEQYQNRSITSLSKEEKKEIQDELWLKFYFLNDLSNLYKDNNSKDFTIKIKEELSDESSDESSNESFNESIKVHKIILLIRSELFRNMFNSIEDKNITSIFDYSGKSYETLKCLINYFYTDKLVIKDGDDPDLICEELEDAIEYFQLNIKSNLKQLIKK
ncbi:speckle-type poz protein [Anaeramoeba flamelloides]|uniref:Speckle-type poz protein n=1 Tax=Anaeramoeba flamelloides TaxID=1746091 RepID=A0ABQ8XU64_9EUKA|nr:speckle-type poz protein [Anaeramoeba flamelloides]